MNRDEIAQMMQDSAGNSWGTEAHFQRFAALVAAAEREECAKAVLDDAWALTFQTFGQYRTALAAAIRARSKR